MIDSHCHLTDPRLFEQLDVVLTRASSAGIKKMITIGTDPGDHVTALQLCRVYSNVRCAIGIHPNYCQEVDESALARLEQTQSDPTVVALGEMGLDYFHNFADRTRQRKFFIAQLELAVKVKKPVVIHCRDAFDDFMAIVRDFPTVPIDIHCFTGSLSEGKRAVEAGYMLGFTGIATYKRSEELRELIKWMPAEQMLVETDSPYLTPEPMRKQKVNEPALVVHVAAMIAQVRGTSVQEIDRITTANVERFFGSALH